MIEKPNDPVLMKIVIDILEDPDTDDIAEMADKIVDAVVDFLGGEDEDDAA